MKRFKQRTKKPSGQVVRRTEKGERRKDKAFPHAFENNKRDNESKPKKNVAFGVRGNKNNAEKRQAVPSTSFPKRDQISRKSRQPSLTTSPSAPKGTRLPKRSKKPTLPAYNQRKRQQLGQNFLKNPALAGYLIRKVGITAHDTVLEIGPGRGNITARLAEAAQKVIAVEKDGSVIELLKMNVAKYTNVHLEQTDFMRFSMREQRYKVFSNIPFSLTSAVVKKLLFLKFPPDETYLFTQKEAAWRLSGNRQEYELSVLTKPWFTYEIVHTFKRSDFSPEPGVDVVLLAIRKREAPLLEEKFKTMYADFVHYAFSRQKKNLMANLNKLFTYPQWKRLAHDLDFVTNVDIRELTPQQWVGLFNFLKIAGIPSKNHSDPKGDPLGLVRLPRHGREESGNESGMENARREKNSGK